MTFYFGKISAASNMFLHCQPDYDQLQPVPFEAQGVDRYVEVGQSSRKVSDGLSQSKRPADIRAMMPAEHSLATWEDENLISGDGRRQKCNAVTVYHPHRNLPVRYNRNNRGVYILAEFLYNDRLVRPQFLVAKKVLDLGMGGGLFVEELRAGGVEAYGLDIALSSEQLPKVYRGAPSPDHDGLFLTSKQSQGYFIQADVAQTGLAADQFDVLFSTYSVFEYELGAARDNPEFLIRCLEECRRILKKGGVLCLSPFFAGVSKFNDCMLDLVDQVEGLETDGFVLSNDPAIYYLVIKKV